MPHAAIARQSASSENGSRSSSDPPPRVSTITSTSGSASSRASAAAIPPTAAGPWTAVSTSRKRAAGKRSQVFSMTSRGAAASRPEISPIRRGQNGSGRFRASSSSPSAASRRRASSILASTAPSPARSMRSARSESSDVRSNTLGRPWTSTFEPASSGGATWSSTQRAMVTRSVQPSTGSRSVRKAVAHRSLRFSSERSPLTQTAGSSSMRRARPRATLATVKIRRVSAPAARASGTAPIGASRPQTRMRAATSGSQPTRSSSTARWRSASDSAMLLAISSG